MTEYFSGTFLSPKGEYRGVVERRDEHFYAWIKNPPASFQKQLDRCHFAEGGWIWFKLPGRSGATIPSVIRSIEKRLRRCWELAS